MAVVIACPNPTDAGHLDEDQIAALVRPPLRLGARDSALPVWYLLDAGGALAGYLFESTDLKPIPGFSGTPINLLVAIDRDGRFLDVALLDHNEPVFVSGLGERPLYRFLEQYPGKSPMTPIKVLGSHQRPASELGTNVYVDGVAKATASVRIINETLLASALEVAREKIAQITGGPVRRPRPDLYQAMDWQTLLEAGLVRHLRLTNAQVDAAFAGSPQADDDPEAKADPDGLYVDLWVADLSLPTVAGNLVDAETLAALEAQIGEHEEAVLVLARGRHPLVAEDFVRNTVPERLAARQGSFPINLRDADIEAGLNPGVPEPDAAMVLRFDTRMGFDPSQPWTFTIKVVRRHGMFMPEVGSRAFDLAYQAPDHYFQAAARVDNRPVWLASFQGQAWNIALLVLFLAGLTYALSGRRPLLVARLPLLPVRTLVLAFTLLFIGWYAQGQLSVVTALGVLQAAVSGESLLFLLYDPFSLVLWVYVLATLVVWGRGTFCGWLCPYGALQELAFLAGRAVGLQEVKLPTRLSRRLSRAKYGVLAVLVIALFVSPSAVETLVEVEPFKTAITMGFLRTWAYVAYALTWILLGMVVFRAFCRFVCPLGAALALAGVVRRWDWLARRVECGSPCKLCSVRCQYDAISHMTGTIDYSECFQCLDCVDIYHDRRRCVPLVLEDRQGVRNALEGQP